MGGLMKWLMRAIACRRLERSIVRGLSLAIVLGTTTPAIASVPLFEVAAIARAEVSDTSSETHSEKEVPPLPFSDPGDLFFGVETSQSTEQKQAPVPMPKPVTKKTLGQRVAAAAIAAEGADVTLGPGRGALACAWAVNRFGLQPILGKSVGKNPNLVVSVQRDLVKQGLAKEVPQSAAQPGDIVVAAGPGRSQHIGIVVSKKSGKGVEALSTRGGRFGWRSDLNFEMKYKVKGQIYRLISSNKINPKPKRESLIEAQLVSPTQPEASLLSFTPQAPIVPEQQPQPPKTPKPVNSGKVEEWFMDRRSLGAVAIGHAEGNLSATGKIRSIYYGHSDPGNGVKNIGFCSLQKYLWRDLNGDGKVSFQEADQHCLELLRAQIPKTTAKLLDFGYTATQHPEVTFNCLDLYNQSRVAGRQCPKRYRQARDRGLAGEAALTWARVESFRVLKGRNKGKLSASGLFRICRNSPQRRHLSDWDCIATDQRRRVRAIGRVLSQWSR